MILTTSYVDVINSLDKINETLSSPDYLGLILSIVTVLCSSLFSYFIATLTINSDKKRALQISKENSNNQILEKVFNTFLPFKREDKSHFSVLGSMLPSFYLIISILPTKSLSAEENWYEIEDKVEKVTKMRKDIIEQTNSYLSFLTDFNSDVEILMNYFSKSDTMYMNLENFVKDIKAYRKYLFFIRKELTIRKFDDDYEMFIYDLFDKMETPISESSNDLYSIILQTSTHLKYDSKFIKD